MKFCTYLTVYNGNKMPPFYIGSTSVDNINRGYYGSASSREYKTTWKTEYIINPSMFKTYIISTHESREEAYLKEVNLLKKLNASINPMYINMSNSSLFPEMTIDTKSKISRALKGRPPNNKRKGKKCPEHSNKLKMHYTNNPKTKGWKHSEETRLKISNSKKGKPPSNLNVPHTEQTKQKISIKRRNNTSYDRPIYQYDDNMNFIQEWSSIKKAAEYFNRHPSSIIQNAKERKTHPHRKSAGFKWSYEK